MRRHVKRSIKRPIARHPRIPHIHPNLVAYFPLQWNLRDYISGAYMDLTRSGTVWHFNPQNILTEYAADTQAFGADGLWTDGAGTNLIPAGGDDFSTWSTSHSSVSTNVSTAPDGTETADAIIANTNDATHLIRRNGLLNAGKTYSFSIYSKRGNKRGVQLDFVTFETGYVITGYSIVYFDLIDATAAKISENTHVVNSFNVERRTNSWNKCQINVTIPADTDATLSWVEISPTLGDDAGSDDTYVGDDTSEEIYIFGPVLEEADYAHSYVIPGQSRVTQAATINELES